MRFTNTPRGFTCACPDHHFKEQVVLDAMQWCSEHVEGWHYDLSFNVECRVTDFGEGIEQASKVWTFRIWFDADDDAVQFKLALSEILASN